LINPNYLISFDNLIIFIFIICVARYIHIII